jgi:hypothetical protein
MVGKLLLFQVIGFVLTIILANFIVNMIKRYVMKINYQLTYKSSVILVSVLVFILSIFFGKEIYYLI